MFIKVIALAGCFVIGSAAFCFESPVAKYEAASAKWEPDIVALQERDKHEVAGKDDILFLGSSSIRLWKDIKEDMKPCSAVSRGYGGAKYSDLAIFTPRLIAAHNPKAVVVFVANDIDGKSSDKNPEEIVLLVDHITSTIQEKFPKIDIFFIGITPNLKRWQVWPEISAANLAIEQYCSRKPTTHFIKTAKEYLTDQGTPRDELFLKDHLHQNRDGYTLWSTIIKRELNRVFSNKPQ